MTPADAAPRAPWIAERRRVGATLAPFYAALAVTAVVVSALDLYESQVVEIGSSTFTRRYGSVWWLTAVDRGGVAGIGAALLLVLILLLLAAGLRSGVRAGVPLAIALLGGALGAMVLLRVGIRPPLPDLAAGGQATIALAVALVLIGTLHTIRLFLGAQPGLRATHPPAGPPGGAGTPPR